VVALDPGDRDRLTQIEIELAETDPDLAKRFRRWKSPAGPQVDGGGWSVVPPWMLMVFLVGFTSWMVTPVLGCMVAVVAGCWVARRSRGDRVRARQPGRR
jgi:Protein of unknown function (DUF3040)